MVKQYLIEAMTGSGLNREVEEGMKYYWLIFDESGLNLFPVPNKSHARCHYHGSILLPPPYSWYDIVRRIWEDMAETVPSDVQGTFSPLPSLFDNDTLSAFARLVAVKFTGRQFRSE